MELKQLLDKQAGPLNLANSEPEPYVLTTQEEISAIEHAFSSLKKLMAWRLANIGFQEGMILEKLAAVDWEKEIDRDKILHTANSNKLRLLEEKKSLEIERERRKKERTELIRKCDAPYFLDLMKQNCSSQFDRYFQQDEDNKHMIVTICYFMSRDERFETELKFDLNKGLLISGVSGLGKTFLFELVKNNPLNPVKIISMIDVADAVKEEGFYHIQRRSERIVYLDDVGTEQATINYFGTKINWFKDFIEKIYPVKSSFKNLVISTNLNANDLEENYGSRVRSRMREMFNVINVHGKDRRR